MKNPIIFVLAGAAAVMALAVLAFWGPFTERPGLRSVEDIPIPAGAAVEEHPSQAAFSREGAEDARQQAPGEPSARPAEGRTSEQAAPLERRFPTAADIVAGMERRQIEAAYGPPSMRTVSVEQGQPVETLVYLRRDPDAATFVLLRAGRVASVATTAY
jgi:hypothetical protein